MIHVLRQWRDGNVTGVCSHLARHRVAFRVVEAWRSASLPPLRPGDAAIALGGPPSVCRFHEPDFDALFLRREALWLEEARQMRVAVLGICLAHQLLGAMRRNEVSTGTLVFGVEPVEITDAGRQHWLFAGVPRVFHAYQHHRDGVRSVGEGTRVLAASPTCAVEAAAWDDRTVSMQFHPEALAHELPTVIERYGHYLVDRGETVHDVMARLPHDYEVTTARMFDNFLYRSGCIGRPMWMPRAHRVRHPLRVQSAA